MTILVLDPADGVALPFHDWFAGRDPVVISRRAGAARPGVRRVGPAWHAVDREAYRVAAERPVTAVVALAEDDLLRAATLRQHWELAGQHRSSALACVDLAVQRRSLAAGGVETVPTAPVTMAADLYQFAVRAGPSLRLRRRRAPGWPTQAVVGVAGELPAAAALAQPPRTESRPNLCVEAVVPGSAVRVVGPPDGAPSDGPYQEVVRAVRAVLGVPDRWPVVVELIRRSDGAVVVDSCRCGPGGAGPVERYRDWALAQAGPVGAEVVR